MKTELCGLCGTNPAEAWGSCQTCLDESAPMIESLRSQECGLPPGGNPFVFTDISPIRPITIHPKTISNPPRIIIRSSGCWFCDSTEGELAFDGEFDTPVHVTCIKEALESDPHHPEARHMKYLLD